MTDLKNEIADILEDYANKLRAFDHDLYGYRGILNLWQCLNVRIVVSAAPTTQIPDL